MREGEHPLKSVLKPLSHKVHRIILPFWIPNVEEPYFKGQPEVLRYCLDSLTRSIDREQSAITLINNHSCAEATAVAESFVQAGLIDKYVLCAENRGKLDPLLAEARAAQEDYLTLADADFLFLPGWEQAVARVFHRFPRAGMVSPFPAAHLTYFYNSHLVWAARQTGKVLSDEDVDLFEQGLGHSPESGLYSRPGIKRGLSWRQQQYVLQRDGHTVVLGAVHALATFRREVVQQFNQDKVPWVFKNGYEHEYLDVAAEKTGYLRVSTPDLWAYHLGNTVPQAALDWHARALAPSGPLEWPLPQKSFRAAVLRRLLPLNRLLLRAGRKWRWL